MWSRPKTSKGLGRERKRHGVDLRPGAKGRSAMVLVNSDFAIEAARPLPPNVVMVGPVGLPPVEQLPPDLEACPSPHLPPLEKRILKRKELIRKLASGGREGGREA